MHTQLKLLLAVWRHSRMGWAGLAFIWALMGLIAALFLTSNGLQKLSGRPAQHALMLAPLMVLAGVAAALLGAAWKRLLRHGASLLQPGAQATARHAGLLQTALVWGAAAVPAMTLTMAMAMANALSKPAMLWAWLLAGAGLTALGFAIGLAAVTIQMPVWFRWAMGFAVIALLQLTFGQALSALHGLGSTAASSLALPSALVSVAVVGCTLLVWSLRSAYVKLVLGAGRDFLSPGFGLTITAERDADCPVQDQPAAWQSLWLTDPPHTRGIWLGLAFSLLVWVVLSKTFWTALRWNGIAPVLIFVACSSMPAVNAAWVSPRLALLPSGLHRPQAWDHLAVQLLRRSAARLPAVLVVVTMLALLWKPSIPEVLALALACLAAMLMNAAVVLAALPVVRSSVGRALAGLGGSITVILAMTLATVFDWPGPYSEPWAWTERALAVSGVFVLFCFALAWAGKRAWARMDWSAQPAEPPSLTRR